MRAAEESLGGLLAELNARARRGMELGLGPTRRALAALGDPHLAAPVVHVAGTNGKGSVCAMVESIARAAGLRTGLTTSPHLCRFAERIRLQGEPVSDAAFTHALDLALHRTGVELTFFEVLTVAAFVAFREARVDLAVVEVGLGGRLDSTNVVDGPAVTAITSIGFDHAELLGPTLTDIAREKAGIAKPGVPLVLGPLPPEADAAIDGLARERGAGPLVRTRGEQRSEGSIGLEGKHQRDNAAVARAIAELLASRWPALRGAVGVGLADVRWPGRLERIARPGKPALVFDCAHNLEAAEALARALADLDADRTTLVFGALEDKPYRGMLELVAPLAARRVYTEPKGRRPASLRELQAIAPGDAIADPTAALAHAETVTARDGTLLVTGSSYLVGELRGVALGLACDPFVAL